MLRLMAGLKATGRLPAAYLPTPPISMGCMRTLGAAPLPATPPAFKSLTAFGHCRTSAASSRPTRDNSGQTGGRSTHTGLSATPLHAAAQTSRTAYAGSGGGAAAYDTSGGARRQTPRRQAQQDRQSPAEARAEAFKRAVPEVFFLRGVSFGERQQNIEAIQKGAHFHIVTFGLCLHSGCA